MSRLNEMIQNLCPDGIPHKPLCEVSKVERGVRVVKKQLLSEGKYAVYQNSLSSMGYHSESNYPAGTTFVIGAGAAGEIGYAAEDFWAADDCYCIVPNESIMGRFIYHVLLNQKAFIASRVRRASIPRLARSVIENLIIPVPPLEVQREIVRILDNFTEQTNTLEKELLAELAARKKQYEYYRDLLLTFGDVNDCSQNVKVERERERERERRARAVRWLTLSEIADVFRGEYITQRGTTPGQIPVILGGQEPAYYIDKSNHEGEIVVIARSGVSAGFVSYWNEPIFVTDGFGYEAKSGIATPKFLYYVLKSIEPKLNAMKRGAGVPHVSGEALSKVELPVPSLDEQAHIVDILDRFDVLCNDISSGLSAEIEARRKQYEYYRDALLTFKEKSA